MLDARFEGGGGDGQVDRQGGRPGRVPSENAGPQDCVGDGPQAEGPGEASSGEEEGCRRDRAVQVEDGARSTPRQTASVIPRRRGPITAMNPAASHF